MRASATNGGDIRGGGANHRPFFAKGLWQGGKVSGTCQERVRNRLAWASSGHELEAEKADFVGERVCAHNPKCVHASPSVDDKGTDEVRARDDTKHVGVTSQLDEEVPAQRRTGQLDTIFALASRDAQVALEARISDRDAVVSVASVDLRITPDTHGGDEADTIGSVARPDVQVARQR